jgi:hypothetical protein
MNMKSIARAAIFAIGISALLTGAGSAKKPKDDTSKRVCKTIMPTGSRMTTRVCKTAEEWAKMMDKTQEGVLAHQTSESTGMEAAAGPR